VPGGLLGTTNREPYTNEIRNIPISFFEYQGSLVAN